MHSSVWFCSILALSSTFLVDDLHKAVNLYVSPSGSDHSDGRSTSHPLKTLQKAVTLLESSDLLHHDVIINLMKGYHDLESPLTLYNNHLRKVVIQAHNNDEVHLTGGKRIPSTVIHPVTDNSILQRLPQQSRSKVLQVKLTEAGITNLGQLSTYGFYRVRQAPLELFYNGIPLRLARWPNENFINIKTVLDKRSFTYDSDRPLRWKNEKDIWVHGFWYWSWADQSVKIATMRAVNKTITLSSDPLYGLRPGHYHSGSNVDVKYRDQGGYFRFINILEELDQPGEYYVDRTSGILYMWPPSASAHVTASDVIYASILDDCVKISGSSNVVFKGFTLEACRRIGIKASKINNITIQEMEVRNTGSYNIYLSGDCRSARVLRCNLHDGDGAIYINGGNRQTLTPSNNEVADNVIWRFSRETVVGGNAVSLEGVGGHVHHNYMHTGQYTAIRWNGNDHVIEYNHLHDMCQNSSDCGAIHTGRDWTGRGVIIRYNYIYNTLRYLPGADVRGIMLDDQYAAATIENNVFFDNEIHVNIGGGRDNIIRNNIFYNATLNSLQVDHRGTSHSTDQELYKKLHAVPYKTGIWAFRYPKLASIDSNYPSEPRGNQIYHNIFYNTQPVEIRGYTHDKPEWFNVTDNGRAAHDSDFYSVHDRDFRPRCTLSDFVKTVNFPQPITMSLTGPRYPVGTVNNRYQKQLHSSSRPPSPCTTYAPALTAPAHSYLPDGSHINTIHKTQNQGCWLYIEKCSAHPEIVTSHSNVYHRDTDHNAQKDETACLRRVPYYVKYCGSQSHFTVIYGPTGAMTLGGQSGCYWAWYGCPKHGSSTAHGQLIPDTWGELHVNAAHDEVKCLSRALGEYQYCGSKAGFPVTSIFLPTGHSKTAGHGCWIKIPKCPKDHSIQNMFYDAWGATNLGTDINESACFGRTTYYWNHCGADPDVTVTAFYRPRASSYTYHHS